MDSIYELDDKNDKKNCSGSGVYASSQTFGYDNSVILKMLIIDFILILNI